MRVFLVLCIVVAAGCSSGESTVELVQPEQRRLKTRIAGPAKLDPPDFSKRTALRMVRKGEEVRVGDSIEVALRAFREEKNSVLVTEMPPGWQDPAYTAQGWDNGSSGFATILYDEKVVLALFHEDRADEARLQEILAVYDRMLVRPAVNLVGSRVRFWFWDQAPHRLMICAVQVPSEGQSISIALGGQKIMDLLGMNPEAAEKDRVAAEKIFQDGLKANRGQ